MPRSLSGAETNEIPFCEEIALILFTTVDLRFTIYDCWLLTANLKQASNFRTSPPDIPSKGRFYYRISLFSPLAHSPERCIPPQLKEHDVIPWRQGIIFDVVHYVWGILYLFGSGFYWHFHQPGLKNLLRPGPFNYFREKIRPLSRYSIRALKRKRILKPIWTRPKGWPSDQRS